MHLRLLPLLTITALAVAACSSQPTAEMSEAASIRGDGERYASITRAGAPFYQYGPAQPSGPDFYLNRGDLVRQVRRESGFSQVQLESGQTGYVANKYLANAPAPPPPPAPQVETVETQRTHRTQRTRQVITTAEPAAPPRSRPSAQPAPAFRLGSSQEAEAPIRFR